MKLLRMRKLAALLMLACAAAQPAAASASIASALALALHADDHEHSIVWVPAEGHLHVVLSHDDASGHFEEGSPSQPVHAGIVSSEDDHVVDFVDSDQATARRAALDPAPPLALAALPPPAEPTHIALRPPPDRRALASDLLKTVVLRL